MISTFFFKAIHVFKHDTFPFSLTFPINKWSFRRLKPNIFVFLKYKTNSALIIEIFDKKKYNIEILKIDLNNNYTEMTIGCYESYVLCKVFNNILQYEWNIIINEKRIIFTYDILKSFSEEEKDKQYYEVINILNTIKESPFPTLRSVIK